MISEEEKTKRHLRNQVQLLHDAGQLNDPEFSKLLDAVYEFRKLQDMADVYFDLQAPKRKNEKRVVLSPTGAISARGQGHHPSTYNAIAMAEAQTRSGNPLNRQRSDEHLQGLADFFSSTVVPGSITKVGTLGVRGNDATTMSKEQKILRGSALLTDIADGFDPMTGAAFNGMPLDAGHKESHVGAPELSTDPQNIRFQNKYENRGQSHAEKVAGQQGRLPTNEELANALSKTFMNKIIEGVKTPRRGSKAHAAYFGPIDNKVKNYIDGLGL